MTRTTLFITSLVLMVGCSKPVEESTLINKDGLMYLPDSNLPYSGEVVMYYATGEKEYEGTYENGLLAKYEFYNRDGTIKVPISFETALFKRGKKYFTRDTNVPFTGPVFSLFENGQIKSEGIIVEGARYGDWTIHGLYGKTLSIKYPIEGLTEEFDEEHPVSLLSARIIGARTYGGYSILESDNSGTIEAQIENFRELNKNRDESLFLVERDSLGNTTRKRLLLRKRSTHLHPYSVSVTELPNNQYIVEVTYDSVEVNRDGNLTSLQTWFTV